MLLAVALSKANEAPVASSTLTADGDVAVGDSSRWITSVVCDDVVCDNATLSRGEDLVLAKCTFLTTVSLLND